MTDLLGILAQSTAPPPTSQDPLAAPFLLVYALFALGGCLIGLASLGLIIWAVVDCAQREFTGENEKVVWILVILLTATVAGPIGAIVYLLAGRPKGVKRTDHSTPPTGEPHRPPA